jgi:hypothetical protein
MHSQTIRIYRIHCMDGAWQLRQRGVLREKKAGLEE